MGWVGRPRRAGVSLGIVLLAATVGLLAAGRSWPAAAGRATGPTDMQQATATPAVSATATPGDNTQPLEPPRLRDLRVRGLRSDALRIDPQTFALSGPITVGLSNGGIQAVTESVAVAFFEDRDLDDRFGAADLPLGVATLPGLAARGSVTLTTMLSGTLRFRDNRVHVMVDAQDIVPEQDEGNNVAHSAAGCIRLAPTGDLRGELAPILAWRWPPPERPIELPASVEVEMAPLVLDLDGDALPEILFITRDKARGVAGNAAGVLRVVSGVDGEARWTAVSEDLLLNPFVTPAAADLDGDGRPEIVAVARDLRSVIAFDSTGQAVWRRVVSLTLEEDSSVSIADLDADGRPEVLVGGAVLEGATGAVRFGDGPDGLRVPGGLAADIDGDLLRGRGAGRGLEIISGAQLVDARGRLIRLAGALANGSFVQAVADIDRDGLPDIIDVQRDGGQRRTGQVRVVDALSGAELWEVPFPVPRLPPDTGPRGGPPAVADLDGDGWPEIAVAGQKRLGVFRYRSREGPDEGVIEFTIDDDNSGKTAVSAFDIDGDGRHELAYTDEHNAWLLRLEDDKLRAVWSVPSPSNTFREMPVFADVTGDGRGELVLPTGQDTNGQQSGLRVYGNPRWAPARPVWNQHAFAGAHVDDRGTVPDLPRPSWLGHNSFRAQPPRWGAPGARPDLTVGGLRFATASDALTATARVGNGGLGPATGLAVRFYEDGRLFDQQLRAVELSAGDHIDVSASLPLPPGNDGPRTIEVRVRVASGGDGEEGDEAAGLLECPPTFGRDNNSHSRRFAGLPDRPASPTAVGGATTIPAATPTGGPGSQSTPTSTPDPSASASPTALPPTPVTPRPTAQARRLHLPLALAGACGDPGATALDLVLLVDASPSMRQPLSSGVTPAAAAALALTELVEALPPPPAGDRVALVSFADAARRLAELDDPRDVVARGLAEPATGRWSRLDLGLAEAARIFDDAPVRPGSRPVVLVVGDGGVGPLPPSAALISATRLREGGVSIFAVGLGREVDRPLLDAVSGGAERVGVATDARMLSLRLETALRQARCLPDSPWPRRSNAP